jgi:5-methylthioadenosine/S-adenosylhomocysteine deaminase
MALDDGAGGLVEVGLSPHAPYSVGPDLWAALADHRELADRRWATHLAESSDEWQAIDSGEGRLAGIFAEHGWELGRWPGSSATPVGRLAEAGALRAGTVAAHCVGLGPGDAEALTAAGVAVAHCPESNARLNCGRAPLEALLDAGVAVGLGSDSPASAGLFDVRAEARAAAREAIASGVDAPTADELLRLATLGGAEALGMADRVGSLEVGKRCDLVALTPHGSDPLIDPTASALRSDTTVDLVLVDGRALVEGGKSLTLPRHSVEAAAAGSREHIGRMPR